MKVHLMAILFLVSCGGGSSSSDNSTQTPEGINTVVNDDTFSMSINFESSQGSASWTIELIDNGNNLGVCEFEQKAKTDSSPMYFKNQSGDPICSMVQIDPSSTVSNLILNSDYDAVRYCVIDNGVKKCGEIRK